MEKTKILYKEQYGFWKSSDRVCAVFDLITDIQVKL